MGHWNIMIVYSSDLVKLRVLLDRQLQDVYYALQYHIHIALIKLYTLSLYT